MPSKRLNACVTPTELILPLRICAGTSANPVTIGTVFHYARQFGWIKPQQDQQHPERSERPATLPEPIDLWAQFDPPELPRDVLPPIIEQFARERGEIMGADPAGLAMSALTVCAAAIRAVDRLASGVYCFDVREDARGVPCVTEINAGRFSMSTNLYDLVGKHNMAATYVRLALGQRSNVRGEYDAAEGYYMVRNLDTLAGIFHADVLAEGIEDARP